jgi:hypothetical protein
VRELVAGRPRAVLGGVLASKAMDLFRHPEAAELMKREATIYEHLSELQGECIPRHGGIGCNPMYCFIYTLTVEQEGVALNQVEGGATEHECELIVGALRKMHEQGVAQDA